MTFDGNTIAEYTIAHGFTPGSYGESVTTTRTTILSVLNAPLSYRDDSLISAIGQDYIHRFQPADLTKIPGGKEKDPLQVILNETKEVWKKSYAHSIDIAGKNASFSTVQRDVAVTTANNNIQEDGNAHSLALTDRERTETDTRREAEQTHKTSELSLDRTQKLTMQNDRQVWDFSEAVLNRSAETTLQNDSQTDQSATSVGRRVAEATRNTKQLNADYSSSRLAYPGFMEFLIAYISSSFGATTGSVNWAFPGWMWEPKLPGALKLLYNGAFYRGLHYITTDDWYDTGGV